MIKNLSFCETSFAILEKRETGTNKKSQVKHIFDENGNQK